MNFQQLRSVQETTRRGFNLTDAAGSLFASQSAISRQIRELEEELGVEIFQRHGKRLIGLTQPGREICQIIELILKNRDSLIQASRDYQRLESGNLVVVANNAQVRYRLPNIILAFNRAFPLVRLTLRQAPSTQIADILKSGQADLGFITEGLPRPANLVVFKAYSWTLTFIAPVNHPLASAPSPSLADIAAYPIITFEEGMVGRKRIMEAFRNQGLQPDIILSAVDSDVIKTYVELGLGIGIIAERSFNAEVDRSIVCLRTDVVMPPIEISIAVRRGSYLRGYALSFIQTVIPELSAPAIRERVEAVADEEALG